jgi:hypothetical protein
VYFKKRKGIFTLFFICSKTESITLSSFEIGHSTCVRASFDLFFLSFQSMATNSENSPGHESVVIDNDEGIIVESNRTITHIKNNVVIPKNNECVLIGNKSLN